MDLEDDYVRLRGKETPVCFSRTTRMSKTRIDIIASNLEKCKEFYYMDAGPKKDHKMGIAIYDLDIINPKKETIPREKRYFNWVFPKELSTDTDFLKNATNICEKIGVEIDCEKQFENDIDYTFYWDKIKNRLVEIAKIREKEINHEENGQKNFLNARLDIIRSS